MYKILLIFIFSFVVLIAQHTEPTILWEENFEIKNPEFTVFGAANITEDNSKIIYNLRTKFTYTSYSGFVQLSDDFHIENKFEYESYNSSIQAILIDILHNDGSEFLFSFYSKNDKEFGGKIRIPLLNSIEENDSLGGFYSGDAPKQQMTGFLYDVQGQYIYFQHSKSEFNEKDTIPIWTIDKYDFDLNLIKSIEIDISKLEIENPRIPEDFFVTEEENYVICYKGQLIDFDVLTEEYAISELDQNGNVVKSKKFNSGISNWYDEVYQFSNKEYCGTGYIQSELGNWNYILTMFDDDFDIIWERKYELYSNTYKFTKRFYPLNNGDFFVSYGSILNLEYIPLDNNFMILYDSKGEELGRYEWGEDQTNTKITDVKYLKDKNIFLVVSTEGDYQYDLDIVLYHIANPTSVENDSYNSFSLFLADIYPNPVSNILNIEFYIDPAKINSVKLGIYDYMGRELSVVAPNNINFNNSNGLATCQIPVENISPGYYFLRVTDRKKTNSKPIIIE